MPPKRNQRPTGDVLTERITSSATPLTGLSAVEWFTEPPLQVSIESEHEVVLKPLNTFDDNSGNVSFFYAGSPTLMLKPQFYLHVQFQIKNADGTVLADGAQVAPVACAAHSIFEDVSLKLGQTVVQTFNGQYPYASYLGLVFRDSHANLEKNDALQLLFLDTRSKFDTTDNTNRGYESRRIMAAKSQTMSVYMPLLLDVSMQDRLIPAGIDVTLTIRQASDAFRIMSGTVAKDEKLHIQDISLVITQVKLNAGVFISAMQQLQMHPMRLPITRTSIVTIQAQQGTSQITRMLVSNAILPRYVLLMMVASERAVGDYGVSPFYSGPMYMSEVYLTTDSQQQIPPNGYKPQREKQDWTREYAGLQNALGFSNTSDRNTPSYLDYRGGYMVYGFSLQRFSSSDVGGAPQSGSLQFTARFSQALGEVTTFIFLLATEQNIYINSSYGITTDFILT